MERKSIPKAVRVLLIVVAIVMGFEIPRHFVVTLSPSLKHRIYFKNGFIRDKDLKRGAYVLAEIETDIVENCRHCVVHKRIGCAAGERLSVEGRDYFCNGEYLGTAKGNTLTGKQLNAYTHSGVMEEGRVFLIGEHKDSLDSRYLGPIPKEKINALTIPLL